MSKNKVSFVMDDLTSLKTELLIPLGYDYVDLNSQTRTKVFIDDDRFCIISRYSKDDIETSISVRQEIIRRSLELLKKVGYINYKLRYGVYYVDILVDKDYAKLIF